MNEEVKDPAAMIGAHIDYNVLHHGIDQDQGDVGNEVTYNPLIPNGIENLELRCVISRCGKPIPPRRTRGASRSTCSPECYAILKQFRKHCIDSKFCPMCYHPCTPQERADNKQWRKDRKQLRKRAGRPRKGPDFVTAARRALEAVVSFKGREGSAGDFLHIVVGEEDGKQICILDLIETALKAPIDM